MKKNLSLAKFVKEESGQTTTEYFLILAVVVTIFMQFRKKLLKVIEKLMGGLDGAADRAIDDMNREE